MAKDTRIRVKATQTGYINERLFDAGEVFVVEPDQFSYVWMQCVDNSDNPIKPPKSVKVPDNRTAAAKRKQDRDYPTGDDGDDGDDGEGADESGTDEGKGDDGDGDTDSREARREARRAKRGGRD